MSAMENDGRYELWKSNLTWLLLMNLPTQERASESKRKPARHSQWKDPRSLWQMWEQPAIPSVHSSISRKEILHRETTSTSWTYLFHIRGTFFFTSVDRFAILCGTTRKIALIRFHPFSFLRLFCSREWGCKMYCLFYCSHADKFHIYLNISSISMNADLA